MASLEDFMSHDASLRERRRFQRVPEKITVKANIVTFPANQSTCVHANSRNLSEGGILLRLDTQFDTGTILEVKIALPDWRKDHPGLDMRSEESDKFPFTAVCRVVRSRKVGELFETAVRFLNIEEDDYRALRDYLKRQSSPKKIGN
jgi:c-di-GMP-binding flagellar brake protein YcgR